MAKPSIISSLQNICNDPEVKMGVNFLDNLQQVLEENETSLVLQPYLKVKSAVYGARRSVKKEYSAKLTLANNEITKLMLSVLINIARKDDNMNCHKTCESIIFDLCICYFYFHVAFTIYTNIISFHG